MTLVACSSLARCPLLAQHQLGRSETEIERVYQELLALQRTLKHPDAVLDVGALNTITSAGQAKVLKYREDARVASTVLRGLQPKKEKKVKPDDEP